MNLTDYTSYDEIRAVLGVSDEEISNTELALPIRLTELEFKLQDVSSVLISTYTTVKAIAEGSRTADQQKFFRLVQFYSAYAVGEELLISQPMFGFKRVTDGKAEAERFDKWEDVKLGVVKGASVAKKRLKLALGALNVGYVTPTIVTTIGIVSTGMADPVTGS